MTTPWNNKCTLAMIFAGLLSAACGIESKKTNRAYEQNESAKTDWLAVVEESVQISEDPVDNLVEAELSDAIAAPLDTDPALFSKGDARSQLLEAPRCDTEDAAIQLYHSAKSAPIPTFDGISPWPGLLGTVWVNTRLGFFAVIGGRKVRETAGDTKEKFLNLNIRLFELCPPYRSLGEGTTTLPLPRTGAPKAHYVHISLQKYSANLNSTVRPLIGISRTSNNNDQIGLTILFRPRGVSTAKTVSELILMKNVKNVLNPRN